MVRTPILVLIGFILFASAHAFAAAPAAGAAKTVAEATKRVESARAALATAVQRIEKEPPSNADLDAALAAVEALKEALNAGANFETEDLDYARTVLAARKELRTHRQYVEERRAKVHIHDFRRRIDGALAPLNERMAKLSEKDPAPKAMDDARAALEAVKKLTQEGRPLASQDPKFAAYLTEVDATLARHEKAIDDRWLQQSAQKQRGLLDESRKTLATALAEVGKAWSDDKFAAADKATLALQKQLDEGKPLEERDKAYRAEAEKARAEITQARRRMDELVVQAGVSRVKAEMGPAHEELVASAKALRARRPTPEQLAEAKTAAFVVRKLVEKYEPQGARSQPIGQYLTEVKNTLVEVEVALQVRSLDAARADVLQALRNLEKRAVTAEQFEEAKTAMVVLEKTLETVHAKNPAISPSAVEARQLLKDGRATMERRRYEVDLQQQRVKVDEARKNAAALVTQVQKEQPSEAQLQEAEKAIQQIGTVLEAGAHFVKKDRDYAIYAKETKERMAELSDRVNRRKVVLAAADSRAQLTERLASTKEKVETAKRIAATDADIETASKSVDEIMQLFEARAQLERQDAGYAAYAERARAEWLKLVEALEFARQARALRRMTGEALAAATKASEAAAAAADLRKRRELYASAMEKLKACQDDGARMVKENASLANIDVLVGGVPSRPQEAMAQCAQQAEALQAPQKKADVQLRFHEGPKKAYDSAKSHLSKGRKSEALSQLNDCIAEGRILENQYPDFKEQKFDVGGSSMSVLELIQVCVKERKPLQAAR
jgi:DNA repair exonuclease SbcCD ATPase subunit